MPGRVLVALLALALATAGSREASADEPGDLEARALAIAAERLDSGRAHLWRNLIWGTASAAGGVALTLASDRGEHPTRWAFGIQTAIWGGIDIGIAAVGLYLLSGPPDERGVKKTLGKERLYHDALLVNVGLDVGYMGLGAVMLAAAQKNVDNAAEWRGHGAAIVIQGAALLTFELIAVTSSRRRLGRLVDLALAGDGRSLSLSGRF